MALLRSFSFGISNGVRELPKEVLGLFSDMGIDHSKSSNHVSEIIDAALDNRINTSTVFNREAYEYAIEHNNCMTKNKKVIKEKSLDSEVINGDSDDVSNITVDLVSYRENIGVSDFENVEKNDLIQSIQNHIIKSNKEYISVLGIDGVFCYKRLLQGDIRVSDSFKEILESDYKLRGMIKYLEESVW